MNNNEPQNLLELKGVTKKYPKFTLDNVSFVVEPGKIVGFIGRNGAGKTTTLKAIMNLISIDSGSVYAFGSDFKQTERDAKQKIGFAFSEINYYPDSKLKVLSAVIGRCYKNFDSDKYHSLLNEFNLDENKKVKELSSGMKVKFSVLLALTHNAELLILDEPTSGLDPVSRDEIIQIFEDFVQDGKRSVLFSTHITSDLEKCADNIVYIHNGKIIFSGLMEDLLTGYCFVEGQEAEVPADLLPKFVSTRTHASKFEGLIQKYNTINMPLKLRQPTLEEVMVFLERGKM